MLCPHNPIMLLIAQPFIENSTTTITARWFPEDERVTATGLAMLSQLFGIMGGRISATESIPHDTDTPNLLSMIRHVKSLIKLS